MGPTQPIGLIGPADIARAFHEAGFALIGAPEFADAAKKIRDAQAEAGPFPIIVVDNGSSQLAEWVESQSRRTDVRIIGTDDGPLRHHPLAVPLPITLGELLDRFQIEAPVAAGASLPIGAGGLTGANARPLAPASLPPQTLVPEPRPISESAYVIPEPPAPIDPAPAVIPQPVSAPAPVAEPLPVPVPSPQGWNPQPPVAPQPVISPHQPMAAPLTAPPLQPHLNIHDQRSQFFQQNVQATRSSEIVISWAGKGGVGKTSYALTIAQTAGAAGLRVLVIDANRGQPSVRNSLRLNGFGLPTITDISRLGPHGIVSGSERISELRTSARGPAHFDVIPAPLGEGELGSAKETPARLYAEAITALRHSYDLIVIDTQIAEAHLTDDIWSEVIIPLMRGGAWGVGIFDESDDGLDLLIDVSRRLIQLGVPNSRLLVLGNQWGDFTDHEAQIVAQSFAGVGSFIGTADVDQYFHNRKVAGFIPTDAPAVAPLVNAVLLQVTGRSEFQAAPETGRGWGSRRRSRREKRGRR